MDILLVNPPPRQIQREDIIVPPLGLAYIASLLETSGHRVEIIDAFALQQTWEIFETGIKDRTPDIIGLSGMTPVIDNTIRAAGICRKYCRYLVAGGPHVTVFVQKIFQQIPELDFAVYGEGEYTFLELANALEKGADLSGIKGLATREGVNQPRELSKTLDAMPFPAKHLLPTDCYRYPFAKNGRVTTMFTSRGCPYHCKFCDKSVFGSIWRLRSAKNVVDEIEEIVNEYKIHYIVIYDDLFTVNKGRVIEICKDILQRDLNVKWKCEGRVDLVDEDALKWMKKAGCSMIAYGVESGNQKSLDYLNKKITIQQIEQAFEMTRRAGIKTMSYFILGIPVETFDEALHTIDFAKKIKTDFAQFSILSPFPGTELYDEAVSKGLYREISAQNPMDKDLKRPVIISENWSENQLKEIVKIAHRRFYLTPGYVARKLTEIRNFKQLISTAKLGLKVLKWNWR
jgi:anaerobic magnesium-protoporphyrin IX monomethyl ester cyclase